MNRLAVIANLKRGAEKEAEELVEKGPPFDPSGSALSVTPSTLPAVTRCLSLRVVVSIS
jgi:hypothetical protein